MSPCSLVSLERYLIRHAPRLGSADRELLSGPEVRRQVAQAMAGSFRQGPGGNLEVVLAEIRPWGFRPGSSTGLSSTSSCCPYEPSRRHAQIEPFGVHPRFQRLGLRRILLLAMLQRFKEQGATAAMVETGVENAAARRTYASAGFERTHTIRRKEKLVSQIS